MMHIYVYAKECINKNNKSLLIKKNLNKNSDFQSNFDEKRILN